jgi:uncharacterized protein YqgV (UPF0045/DUF77 family)
MSDFETHPIGTAQKLRDMETELSILRRAEEIVIDASSANAAADIITALNDHKVTA